MTEPLPLPCSFMLHKNQSIPAVGLGTFQIENNNNNNNNNNNDIHISDFAEEVVFAALTKHGYRHVDTASAYGNEREVGRAIHRSRIPREEIFVTTKLGQTWHRPDDVEAALDKSLKDLGLDYVDLYLIHFPHAYAVGPKNSTIRHSSGNGKKKRTSNRLTPDESKPVIDYALSRAYPDVWKAMEVLVDKGKTKAIGEFWYWISDKPSCAPPTSTGVTASKKHELKQERKQGLSNFNILKTKRILECARIRPVANQVEIHPYLPQQELVEFCKQEGIQIIAHQPLGGKPISAVNPNASRPGPLVDHKIVEIARQCGKSPAQVILSWAVQRGAAVIPKTSDKNRLAENIGLSRLSEEHCEKIDRLSQESGNVRYLDPAGHIGFDIFNEEADEPVWNSAPWD